jgi:hypothetical protein
MRKEKELLCQQLELLAEQSKGAMEKDLSELSDSMCEVYKSISQSHAAFFASLIVGANLVVCFLILLKKFFRSND